MHLGWFTNYLTPDWNGPWSGRSSETWLSGDFHVNVAKRLEEACFDYLLLEDSSFVSNTYAGNFELELKQMSRAPKNDPMPLAAAIARETRHLGVVVTANTSFYPPFLLARLIRTLDHLTKGRIGWNVVTGAPDQALANYGLAPGTSEVDGVRRDSGRGGDHLSDHDRRYDRADEFVRLVIALWESWDEDAIIADRANDRYIESSRVHTVDFEGEWFRSRGPLNNPPSPQYRPVIAQAGGSERGRELAARTAEIVFRLASNIDRNRAFYKNVKDRMPAFGRDPNDLKIMPGVVLNVGETEAEAQAKVDYMLDKLHPEVGLLMLQEFLEADLSGIEFDKPFPMDRLPETPRGSKALFDELTDFVRSGKTVGELVRHYAEKHTGNGITGTPKQIADFMEEWRGYQKTVMTLEGVEMAETARGTRVGVYCGEDGDRPTRTMDALDALHG